MNFVVKILKMSRTESTNETYSENLDNNQCEQLPDNRDPDMRKLIQRQLMLVFHTDQCQKRTYGNPSDNLIQDVNKCNPIHCKTMKELLNHFTNCKMDKDCTMPHCSSSRQMVIHWKNCSQSNCSVCLPVKQAGRANHGSAQMSPGDGNMVNSQQVMRNAQQSNQSRQLQGAQAPNVLQQRPLPVSYWRYFHKKTKHFQKINIAFLV